MKIKREYYCITDKYNKPDYRFLFETLEDAKKKIDQIKNSTKGETLILSEDERDFFVDGVKRDFIGQTRKIQIKKGCWNNLKISKLSFASDVNAEKLFKTLHRSDKYRLSFVKERERETLLSGKEISLPSSPAWLPNPMLGFDWGTSFLKTKSFAGIFAMLCLCTIGTVFTINHHTTFKMSERLTNNQKINTEITVQNQTKVLGKKDAQLAEQFDQELEGFVLDTLKKFDNLAKEDLENEIRKIVKGTPMEEMASLISQKDRKVAAFMIGIGMKESRFGIRSPVSLDDDGSCYNYWGVMYLGKGRRSTGGNGHRYHACFDSPQDAVDFVGNRIEQLVKAEIDTPQEMVLWKCGSDKECQQNASGKKWISDINIYFSQLNGEENKNES